MKILSKYTTGQNTSASSRKAAFQIKMYEAFWKRCDSISLLKENSDNYYAVNRALCDAFDELVEMVGVTVHFDRQKVEHLGDKLDDYATHLISQMLAKEIEKHNFIPIRKDTNQLYGAIDYECDISIIITPNPTNKKAGVR